jgi:LPXTG-motif cell wall-anchored protein
MIVQIPLQTISRGFGTVIDPTNPQGNSSGYVPNSQPTPYASNSPPIEIGGTYSNGQTIPTPTMLGAASSKIAENDASHLATNATLAANAENLYQGQVIAEAANLSPLPPSLSADTGGIDAGTPVVDTGPNWLLIGGVGVAGVGLIWYLSKRKKARKAAAPAAGGA